MCQLTYANFNTAFENYLFITMQLIENSKNTNKDGYGFFSLNGKKYNSEHCPSLVTNFSEQVLKVIDGTPSPILAHVRLATITNGQKIVCKENSHPFEGERFVFAHNGVLEFKVEDVMKEEKYKGMIDSQIFHDRLEEWGKENPELTLDKFLPNCVGEFYGKFAFLIYDKQFGNMYAVRGKERTLSTSEAFIDGKKIGYVINTQAIDLKSNIFLFPNVAFCTTGKKITFGEVKELEMNSIFLLKNMEIEKIGDIKEEEKPVKIIQPSTQGWAYRGVHPAQTKSKWWEGETDNFFTKNEFHLSLPELNYLCYLMVGGSMLSLTEDDLAEIEKFTGMLRGRYAHKKRMIWEKITMKCVGTVMNVYEHFELQFPYFMNTVKELNEVYKILNSTEEAEPSD